MFHWKPALAGATGIAGAGLLVITTAAHADVKAGVDAWSAGNYARAVAEWRAPAAKGDADALFNLAQAYRLGRGVSEDPRQAETYYARAAAKGHLKAADNYGLLLFQDGRREQAMPYITAAAERGDPRAQYLLGIAHFNGDLVAKDWVRAYALLTLANGAGLPQAGPAIKQMDEHVPLTQRQQAQSLAASIRANADAARSSQMAAADLGEGGPVAVIDAPSGRAVAPQPTALPPTRLPQAIAAVAVSPSISAAEAAVAEAMRATGTESPATAGADYVRAGRPGTAPMPERVARATAESSPLLPARAEPAAGQKPAASGPWKLQLGAFSVSGNADRAWTKVSSVPVLAGKSRQLAPAGRLTKLFAAGWPTQSAAQGACNALKASGHACIVTR
ncbi:Sel1 repeat protein [Tsuneonella dongtanensis]|uniref:Sel1 repeat protein n=1 Tax=Tsuneonella dongtanensis TaxID=692370 RepID=A0A1B2AFM0_9SPHN|nr:SPOR domain-containing protein [Tsuneonella dongtanensis]ANY20940.1 Sel1 repeat protein [Tsuneonella dongtanensis]